MDVSYKRFLPARGAECWKTLTVLVRGWCKENDIMVSNFEVLGGTDSGIEARSTTF